MSKNNDTSICIKSIKRAFTHGGAFHADDVFSTAFIKMLNPDIEVIRGFQIPEGFQGIVYDIGCGEFDHHQADKETRANGKPYAAFGLLWRAYGHMLLQEDEVRDFDESFVEPMDYSDNTGEPFFVSGLIAMMNPSWDDDTPSDEAFFKAVDFAIEILNKYFDSYRSRREARKVVEQYITDSKILILPRFIPWKDAVCHRDIYYVVFPSNRGGYNIQAVPVSCHDITLKKSFPKEWRGCDAATLREKTKIDTVSFCHTSGFMCVTETIEDAVKLAELSIAA